MCCIPSPRLHIACDHGFFLMSSRSFIAFRPLNGTQRLTRPLRVSCYNRSSPHEEATPKKGNAGIAFTLKKMKSAQTITHSSMLFSLNCTENCILFIYPILTMSQIFLAATTTLSRFCTQRRHLLTASKLDSKKTKDSTIQHPATV